MANFIRTKEGLHGGTEENHHNFSCNSLADKIRNGFFSIVIKICFLHSYSRKNEILQTSEVGLSMEEGKISTLLSCMLKLCHEGL